MFRIGNGFDVHAFAEGRPLIIGGVKIPSERGLAGHSDADVLVHAIMDALLGALAAGDIGQRFPNNDPTYMNADSLDLLSDVFSDSIFSEWTVSNIDSVIVAESPKMSAYFKEMRLNISKTLGIGISEVSIKATTTERLGFCGREEGIAAMATVLLASKKNKIGVNDNAKDFSRVRPRGFQRQGNDWKNKRWKDGNNGSPSFPKRSSGKRWNSPMGY
ncbi:MAG TPA: 2-C-methyl-D-erythritol 2,4-cyclodiphosphate synthase [Victivallales bacterium]|nr:2-C-methyl-D-erythritol 2,4-cyclodiphosphate synthase [Victivallales bacterium]